MILAVAEMFCPEAAAEIKEAIRLPCSIWLFAPSVLWRRKDCGYIRSKSILEPNTFGSKLRESTFAVEAPASIKGALRIVAIATF
jgi:hypothetical protein